MDYCVFQPRLPGKPVETLASSANTRDSFGAEPPSRERPLGLTWPVPFNNMVSAAVAIKTRHPLRTYGSRMYLFDDCHQRGRPLEFLQEVGRSIWRRLRMEQVTLSNVDCLINIPNTEQKVVPSFCMLLLRGYTHTLPHLRSKAADQTSLVNGHCKLYGQPLLPP